MIFLQFSTLQKIACTIFGCGSANSNKFGLRLPCTKIAAAASVFLPLIV
jgi:hypothetical protein